MGDPDMLFEQFHSKSEGFCHKERHNDKVGKGIE
jgi:hypothetical protein